MGEYTKKEKVSKIYCEKCDTLFHSRKKYDDHYSKHDSGVYCESCPLDVAVDKILGLFRRK